MRGPSRGNSNFPDSPLPPLLFPPPLAVADFDAACSKAVDHGEVVVDVLLEAVAAAGVNDFELLFVFFLFQPLTVACLSHS